MKLNNLRTLAVTILTSSVLAACGGGGGGAAPAAPQTPATPAATLPVGAFCMITPPAASGPMMYFSKVDATHFSVSAKTLPTMSQTAVTSLLTIAQNGVSFGFNPDLTVSPALVSKTFLWPYATYGAAGVGGTFAAGTTTNMMTVVTPAAFVPGPFTVSYVNTAPVSCTW